MVDLELFRLAGWVAFWCSASPLLAVALRRVKPAGSLLAHALFVSFVADGFGYVLRGQGHETLWLTYLYAPIQFALFLELVAPQVRPWKIWAALVGVGAFEYVTLGQPIEPAIQIGGGLVVATLAFRQRIRPLALYAGGGAICLLGMALTPISMEGAWPYWYIAYQAIRTVALAWTTAALMQWPARWEARHGRRADPPAIALSAAVAGRGTANGRHTERAVRPAPRRWH